MKIIYYVAISADGYIADKEGGIDWLEAYNAESVDYGYTDFYNSIEVLIIGRRTFDQVRSFGSWPYAGKRCIVLTRSPLDFDLPDVEASFSPEEAVTKLRQAGVNNVWLVGGASLATAFLTSGLIDDIILTVMPILLGDGIKLFDGNFDKPMMLDLVKKIDFDNGVVQLNYENLIG